MYYIQATTSSSSINKVLSCRRGRFEPQDQSKREAQRVHLGGVGHPLGAGFTLDANCYRVEAISRMAFSHQIFENCCG